MHASTPTLSSSRRSIWLAGTLLTAVTAVAAAVFLLRSPAAVASAAVELPATPVSVATVVPSDVAIWDEFSGRLEAVERVEIRPRVAGTVQEVHFREGALVAKGALLLSIDPAPFLAEVDRAEAQVAAAGARHLYSLGEQDRALRLLDEGAIAQREADERVHAQREAEANLRAARAALQSARLSLGYTQVRAPVAGRVGRLEVTVGNLVAAGPGAPLLTTLVSVSPIYASFDADEQIVARLLQALPKGAATRAQIESIPVQMGTAASADTPFAGKLQLVDNQVDPGSGTVRLRAAFDNANGRLIPGQFARLRMGQPGRNTALLVNERAVGTDQNKKYVLVVDQDNKAVYREVTLGAHVDGLRIVSAGLQPQERVIVGGLQRVRPGALVAPQPVPMGLKAEVASAAAPRS